MAEINCDPKTCLTMSAMTGNTNAFLKSPAYKKEPLFTAVSKCDLKTVRALIKNPKHTSVTNKQNETVLHEAIRYRLKERKAALNKKKKEHIQCEREESAGEKSGMELIQVLVDAGVDLEIKDKGLCTVLHVALTSHDLPLVKYLLSTDMNISTGVDSRNYLQWISSSCFSNCPFSKQFHLLAMQAVCRQIPSMHIDLVYKVIYDCLVEGEENYDVAAVPVQYGGCVRRGECCEEEGETEGDCLMSMIVENLMLDTVLEKPEFLVFLMDAGCPAPTDEQIEEFECSDDSDGIYTYLKNMVQISRTIPRSLQNAARISIRQCIQGNYAQAVEALSVSHIIQKYLMYTEYKF